MAWPLAVAASGCATLNDAPRFEFFVLEDLRTLGAGGVANDAAAVGAGSPRATDTSAQASPARRTLLVSMGQSQALYDSDRMVFSPDGVSRAFFQYSNWSERPARRLAFLAERRLAQALATNGGFDGVALSTAGVRGDTVLTLRLDELVLDESSHPSTIRLTVLAEIVDWRSRRLIGRRTISRTRPVPTVDARGMAAGGSIAVTELLDELVAWVATVAAAPMRSPLPVKP